MSEQKRTASGVPYDHVRVDRHGTRHYSLDHALGGGQGPAYWSSENDCNGICGCHLANKCQGCGVCTSCEGCFCLESEY